MPGEDVLSLLRRHMARCAATTPRGTRCMRQATYAYAVAGIEQMPLCSAHRRVYGAGPAAALADGTPIPEELRRG